MSFDNVLQKDVLKWTPPFIVSLREMLYVTDFFYRIELHGKIIKTALFLIVIIFKGGFNHKYLKTWALAHKNDKKKLARNFFHMIKPI